MAKRLMPFMASIIMAVMLSKASYAQGALDSLTPPLPTVGERKAAEIASWATVIVALALDANATIGKCDGQDQCYRAVTLTGVRIGATLGATALVKHFVQRDRPCAPSCGIDTANASFYSGHTALAFSTLGGPRLAFALPLSVGTAGLRVAAGKHWLSDVLVGAGVGLLTSRIR
jgi:membrane-associated phospholipid phosphatase